VSEDTAPRAGEAAVRLLSLLPPARREQAHRPFDHPDRRRWTYLPGPRPGLVLREMDDPQREAAFDLLASGLSPRGYASARGVMALEAVLHDLEERAGERGAEQRHPLHYWCAVFGDPGADQPWGWSLGGHHVSVHATVVGDEVAVLPVFLGANPAVAPDGSRALPEEEDLGLDLVASLDHGQRRIAVLSPDAPDDIRTGRAARAEISRVPTGIAWADLDTAQQTRLRALLEWYAGRCAVPPPLSLEQATFAWLGGTAKGEPHYYAVRAGRLFVELDNTQDGANHVHTVLRDLDRDWGEDLLDRHLATEHGR
jgi:hypothetical protein